MWHPLAVTIATASLPHLIPSRLLKGPYSWRGGRKSGDHLWTKFVHIPFFNPLRTSHWGEQGPLAPGPTQSSSIVYIRPGQRGAGFKVKGRQVLGRQLPGQREQGVSEVVAMGTWMLTKAREAVSSHSALLRSPKLVSQAGSPFALRSTGRRVAPSSGSRASASQT